MLQRCCSTFRHQAFCDISCQISKVCRSFDPDLAVDRGRGINYHPPTVNRVMQNSHRTSGPKRRAALKCFIQRETDSAIWYATFYFIYGKHIRDHFYPHCLMRIIMSIKHVHRVRREVDNHVPYSAQYLKFSQGWGVKPPDNSIQFYSA